MASWVRQVNISDAETLGLGKIALRIYFLQAVHELVVFGSNRDHKLAADLKLGEQLLRNIRRAGTDMNGVIRRTLSKTKSTIAADENNLARVKLRRVVLRQILTRQVDQRFNVFDTNNTCAGLVSVNRLVEGSAQDS